MTDWQEKVQYVTFYHVKYYVKTFYKSLRIPVKIMGKIRQQANLEIIKKSHIAKKTKTVCQPH